MICDCCGIDYKAIYNVPNELWTKIAPKPESLGDYIEHQFGGLLCVDCAFARARDIGVDLLFEGRARYTAELGAQEETDGSEK